VAARRFLPPEHRHQFRRLELFHDRLQTLAWPPLRFDKPRLLDLISLGSDTSIAQKAADEVAFYTLLFPSGPEEAAIELLDAFAHVDVRDPCLLGNLAAYRGLEALAL
jgi:hypothetical protein